MGPFPLYLNLKSSLISYKSKAKSNVYTLTICSIQVEVSLIYFSSLIISEEISRACFCIYLLLNILSRQRRWIQNEKPLAQAWNCNCKNIASKSWGKWSQNQNYCVKWKLNCTLKTKSKIWIQFIASYYLISGNNFSAESVRRNW